ncbi:2-oxoglutarate (2OG) and Fe(II)-dependent oxygenase superfamily protein [Rhynchospora pubera]|uniref:2-oxoglutarate (2OG) and Fe(II)-dependent oxygenase superfamily protein n=1 Tax=Rhynchospora pubera TaxID=906938 RepID=A0AAV8CQT0_9POAL|nr:2-oxoglutarate (2OG) and Fe(II)-dependent oxygenase superfamily protein [Rhynchospora pubera]
MVAMQVPVPLVSGGIGRVKMSDLIASEGFDSFSLHADPVSFSEFCCHSPARASRCCPAAGLIRILWMAIQWMVRSQPSDLISMVINVPCMILRLIGSKKSNHNLPLRNHELSSSVLSLCCHSRPSFLARPHHPHTQLSPLHYEHQLDKTLLTLIKPDSPGLHIKDLNGCWLLADTNLGPHDVLVYPGLSLYQETAGYVVPALHRTDVPFENNLHGRCSLAFKLMPKSIATLSSTEMQAAGYGVEPRFQNAIPVSDFMQRSHPVDQLFSRNAAQIMLPDGQAASLKASLKKKRETSSSQKSLPPSKRLRLEAQRVLKEKVMEIAEKKGSR